MMLVTAVPATRTGRCPSWTAAVFMNSTINPSLQSRNNTRIQAEGERKKGVGGGEENKENGENKDKKCYAEDAQATERNKITTNS